jgi:hypothetical protein
MHLRTVYLTHGDRTVGMIGIAAWDAVTAVGFPPRVPADFHWTWVLFVGFAFWALSASVATAKRLEKAFEPRVVVSHDALKHDGFDFKNRQISVSNSGVKSIHGVRVLLTDIHPVVENLALPIVLRPKDVNTPNNDYVFTLNHDLARQIGVFGLDIDNPDVFILYTLTNVLRRPIRALPPGKYYRLEIKVVGDDVVTVTKNVTIGIDQNREPVLRIE